jgi:hypothetical protein
MVPVILCRNSNVALHQIAKRTCYNGSFRRWVKRQSIKSRPIGFPWQHIRSVPNGNSQKASQLIFSRTDIRNAKFEPSFQLTTLGSIDYVTSWRMTSTHCIPVVPFTFFFMQSMIATWTWSMQMPRHGRSRMGSHAHIVARSSIFLMQL